MTRYLPRVFPFALWGVGPFTARATLVLAAVCLSSPAAGQGRGDWRESYRAARESAGAAYDFAASAFGGDSAQTERIRAHADAAGAHAAQAKDRSRDAAVDRWLYALIANLDRLDTAFMDSALAVADTSRWDNVLLQFLREPSLRERPISYEAARSSLMGLEWGQRLNRRGTLVLHLRTEFREIIDELDRLSAVPEWRPGLTAGVFEEDMVSVGMVAAVRDMVVMPAVLLSAGGDQDWAGFEIGAGFRSGDLVFVPGAVLLRENGWRAGPSVTIVLVRPGWLSIGVSVSELQGIGIRTVIDPPRLRKPGAHGAM